MKWWSASWSSGGACSTTTLRRPATASRSPFEPMATTAAAKPTITEAPQRAAIKAAKTGGLRPDLATISGIALALAGIIGGLLPGKGSLPELTQGTAALIVVGGNFGGVLGTTPMA